MDESVTRKARKAGTQQFCVTGWATSRKDQVKGSLREPDAFVTVEGLSRMRHVTGGAGRAREKDLGISGEIS